MNKTNDNKLINNVFIDTSVFIRNNFLFKRNEKLAELTNLHYEGKINVFLTEITYKEVISNITEKMQKATQKLKTSDCIILKNFIKSYNMLTNCNNCVERVIKDFEQYIKQTGIIIINIDKNLTQAVFNKYFNLEPPFSEKKKYEFPDAFTLETIENWCIKNNTKTYFVSDDVDCKDFAEKSNNIKCLTSLSELINIVRSDYEENYKKFIDSFENNIDLIKATIFEYLFLQKETAYNIDFSNCTDIPESSIKNYKILSIKPEDKIIILEKSIREITDSTALYEVSINNTILIKSDKMGFVETKRYLLSLIILLEAKIVDDKVVYNVINKHINIEIPFFAPI